MAYMSEVYIVPPSTVAESSVPTVMEKDGQNVVMENRQTNNVMEIENILKSHGISLLLFTNHARELPITSYL